MLQRWERFLGFIACCLGGMACFGIAFLFLPLRTSPLPYIHSYLLGCLGSCCIVGAECETPESVGEGAGGYSTSATSPYSPPVAVKPRKFALAFTLGSILFMLGFAILHGPWNRTSTLHSPCPPLLSLPSSAVLPLSYSTPHSPSSSCTQSPNYTSKYRPLTTRPQTHPISRTPPLLPLLLWLPRPHPLLCHRRPVVHRYGHSGHHPGRRARLVLCSVFPRGYYDVAVWGADDVEGCGEYIAYMRDAWVVRMEMSII